MLLYVHLWISAFVQYTQQFRSGEVQHNAAKAASSSVPNCFYGGVGAAKYGVWLTDSIFLIFGRGHIHITHDPPRPTPSPALSPAALHSALRHAMQILGDSKIPNAFNSKKRFFNEFKDLEDLEY